MPDGSCSISDIQDYFEYIIKKHKTIADNLLVNIYTNKIKNRIVFKVKTGYKLQLLSPDIKELKNEINDFKGSLQFTDNELKVKIESLEKNMKVFV